MNTEQLFDCEDCGKMSIQAEHNCVSYNPRLVSAAC
jgi:hypothetical protein